MVKNTSCLVVNRVTMESDEILHEDLEEKFCQSLLHPHSSTNPPLHGRLTPYKCPNCHGRRICVETEVACLVCRSCGLQGPGGFEHGYQSMAGKDTHKAYQYKPVAYMLRLLNQVQAPHIPRLLKETLDAIRLHLLDHAIPTSLITPTDVLQTLRDLKLHSLYAHRWFLTKKLNRHYVPLRVPHELEERVCCVFVAAYEEFLRQYLWVSEKKRKFPSYIIFIQIVLQYLGIRDVDRHFTPPTNIRNRRAICKKICGLIKSI